MAKAKSLFNVNGTFQGVTHVDSKRYGKHIRAPRGTYKDAVVNEAFKRSGEALVNANLPAKVIKDALDPYRHNFRDGTMWQRLVSTFKKQTAFDFSALEGFELYREHLLSRHFIAETSCEMDEKETLNISLRPRLYPAFKGHKNIDQYQVKLIVVFPNLALKTAETTVIDFPLATLKKDPEIFQATVPLPAQADTALLCVKLEGWSYGEVSTNLRTKGMAIVKVVKIFD